MDATRIHLFITHLPVFGLFLGFFVLLFGLLREDKGVKVVALAMIIVAITGGFIASQTGEFAEETVESIAVISHDAVELHEESAEITMLFLAALGVLSAIALFLEIRDNRFAKQTLVIVLALSALTFYFVARTAMQGGKIRHTEISVPK
jgi:uncharacterized membrane protein